MNNDDRNLVYGVGMIYKNRENQHIIDAGLEQSARDAQQIGDGIIFLKADSVEMSQRDVETANICRQMAIRYRPKNLNLYINIENHETNSILNQNYGDSKITVYKDNEEPLDLGDMDVRSYFHYEFEGTGGHLMVPIDSFISLIRRCQGTVFFQHSPASGDIRTFDEPSATIVPSLKRLLTFLWEQASSRKLDLDLNFSLRLDIGQQQEIHSHCTSISPGAYEMNGESMGVAEIPYGRGSVYLLPPKQWIHVDTQRNLRIVTTAISERNLRVPYSMQHTPSVPRALFVDLGVYRG